MVIRTQIIDQQRRVPGGTQMAEKVDWSFNEQGRIRMDFQPWQKD